MFPQRFWPGRYFPGRYWPKTGFGTGPSLEDFIAITDLQMRQSGMTLQMQQAELVDVVMLQGGTNDGTLRES